jgi:hypothetical protein
MRRVFVGLALATALAVASAPAKATVYTFIGTFSGAAEVPPTGSAGTGTAIVSIDDVTRILSVNFTFTGLGSLTTVAHIHCCATTPTSGVATQTPSFSGFPADATSGAYSNTFDLNLNSSWNAAFITNNGGNVNTAFTAFLAGLRAGRGYGNIHTQQFTGGEIRANLVETPLPGAMFLFAPALGLILARRKKA